MRAEFMVCCASQPTKNFPMSTDKIRRLDREFSRNFTHHVYFDNELNRCAQALRGVSIQ